MSINFCPHCRDVCPRQLSVPSFYQCESCRRIYIVVDLPEAVLRGERTRKRLYDLAQETESFEKLMESMDSDKGVSA